MGAADARTLGPPDAMRRCSLGVLNMESGTPVTPLAFAGTKTVQSNPAGLQPASPQVRFYQGI